MKPQQKGGNHVPATTLRNGDGKSRDSACRSIIFMAVHRRTAFFARLFTGVSAIYRGQSAEDRTHSGVSELPQGISVTVGRADYSEDLCHQRPNPRNHALL